MLITAPVRIADEKPSESPVLVGDRIHDLGSGSERALVDLVDVVDVDRDAHR
jgi:hypothetical protein